MKAIITGLFGGGSSLIYLLLISVMGFFYLDYVQTKNKNRDLIIERDQFKAQSAAKDQTIASQARSNLRRAQSNKEQQNAEDAIRAVPDSKHCVQSGAILMALDGLRRSSGLRQPASPKPANPD